MSASPQRPLEIGLPTLPELQGAAVSRECLSQFFPPGNIAELRASPRLRSLEQLRRLFPAGPPYQGIDLAAPNTLEASLERRCISLGPADCRERLSFSVRRSAATFQRVISHMCESRAGSGIRTGGQLSLEEGGHRGGPGSTAGTSLFQRRMGGCPILDLRLLNRSVRRLKFRMLTVKQVVSQIRSEDWFVTIDLKDAYFHIHPSQSQYVPEVRFQGQSLPISGSSLQPNTFTPNFHEGRGCCPGSSATPGHPHTQLHRRLVDFSSFRADGGSTSRCRSRSITENHLSRRGVGFDHDAGTVVPCSDRVESHHSQESQRRPVTHGQAVSKTAGSDGSCVQRDTFWPAVHETPTEVAQVQGVLPEGKPIPHDQGHAVMPTCLGHVEETLVLVSGPGPGSSLPPRNASDGCIPDRLGGRS